MCAYGQAAWEALSRVLGSVPKEVLPSYIKLVRVAVSTAREKERRKRKVWFFSNNKFLNDAYTLLISIC